MVFESAGLYLLSSKFKTMKTTISFLLTLSLLSGYRSAAQSVEDVKAQIETAKKALSEKNYRDVNFSLQQALGSLAVVIGNEVLAVLPADINGLKAVKENDNVSSAAMMMAGTTIQRVYGQDDKRIELNIVVNSPMVASLAMVLNNPMYASSMGSDQKIVSVGSKRGILKMDKENKSAELQVVSGSNLTTIQATGIINAEADMTGLGAKIDYAKIDALVGN